MFYYLKGIAAHVAPNLAVIDCRGRGVRLPDHQLHPLRPASGAGGQAIHPSQRSGGRHGALWLRHGKREELLPNAHQRVRGRPEGRPVHSLRQHPEGLATAIITGNEKALTVAPGVGKKIAQRVLLELKDKLAKGQLPAAGESYGGSGLTVIPQDKTSEATAALAVLGYGPAEINLAPEGLGSGGPVLGGHRAPGPEKNAEMIA